MADRKKFRIDSFYGLAHAKAYFDFEEDAIEYGLHEFEAGNVVFLLRLVSHKKYEVVCLIEL